jgi:hypothetical protein
LFDGKIFDEFILGKSEQSDEIEQRADKTQRKIEIIINISTLFDEE